MRWIMNKISALLISFSAAAAFGSAAYAADYSVTLNDVELDYERGYISVSGNIGEMNSGSYVSIELTDEDGDTVYIDQITSTSKGMFDLDIKMTSEYRSGEYTVTVRGTQTGAPAEKTFTFDSTKDNFYVENAELQKDGEAAETVYDGDTLSVDFDYFSSFSYAMGEVRCRWQLAGSPDGEYFDLSETEGSTYTLSLSDIERVCAEHPDNFADKKLYIRAAVRVKTENSQDYSAEAVSGNTAEAVTLPYVTDIRITGNASVGSTLSASYVYHDFQNKPEQSSEYEWIKSRSQDGEYTSAGKGLTYIPGSSDQGYYLKLRITPRTNGGSLAGAPAVSAGSVYIGTGSSGGGGGGGNGGGGGGGGSTSVSRPVTPAATQSPEEEPTASPGTDVNGSDTEKGFSDVDESHWAKNEIGAAVEHGIVSGFGDGTFRPEEAVTRAEFSKMILSAIGESGVEYGGGFSDVAADAWYAEAVAACAELGIVSGDSGMFRPDDKITREEMAKMVVLAYRTGTDGEEFETGGEISFTDSDAISGWALEFAEECAYRGFMNGMPDGSFAPAANATRAQAAAVANRLYDSLNG